MLLRNNISQPQSVILPPHSLTHTHCVTRTQIHTHTHTHKHRSNTHTHTHTANNVLILRKCSCPDILHCRCPKQNKCEVKLADFDSLKKTLYKRSAAQFVKLCCDSLMNDMDRNKVKGTPAYRAPEVCTCMLYSLSNYLFSLDIFVGSKMVQF